MATPIRFEQEPSAPPGTGLFHFDDGRSTFAYEPALAAQLAPKEDLRTADARPPDPWYDDPADPVQRPDGAPAGMPAPPPRSVADVAPPTPGAPSQARDGMARIPLPGAGAPQGGSLPEPPPIRQAARPAGYIPGARSTTIEAGPEYDLGQAADRAAANREVVKANLANFEATRQAAENEGLAQQIRGADLADRARAQQRELQEKQQRYDVERAKASALVDAAEQRKIEPNRLFQQQGVGGSVLLIIGQALGAFGASLNHTENWAATMVNKAVDRDIAAQEDEIRSGRVSANNRLARITDQMGGDIEQAKSVLKETHLAALDAQIKEHAAWAKAPEAQRAAQLWLAQNQQARLEEEQKQQQLSMGKTITKIDAKYQAAQAGGTRERTPEEQAKYWKAMAEIKKNRGLAEGTALDATDQKAVERYGKGRQGAEGLKQQIEATVSAAGGEIGKDGRVKLPEDVPGVGRIKSNFVPDWLLSERGRRVRQNFGESAARALKEKSGASATDAEYKRLEAIYQGGAKNEADLQEGLQILYNIGQNTLKNVDSSFPANVRQTYKQNRQGSNAEQYAEEDESDVAPL